MRAHELPTQLWAVEVLEPEGWEVFGDLRPSLAGAEHTKELLEVQGAEARVRQARVEWR